MVMTARFATASAPSAVSTPTCLSMRTGVRSRAEPDCHEAQSQDHGDEIVAHEPLRKAVQRGDVPGAGV